jgi:hypothetical protein
MRYVEKSRALRVLNNPHAVAERLSIWSEDARRNGRFARSHQLLLAAWEAFDLPSVADVVGRPSNGQTVGDHGVGPMDQAA